MSTTSKYTLTDIPRDIAKGEADRLGIGQYENGLINFIEHANTPITIALQGEWGSGKTSLMNTLRKNLCEGTDAKYFSVEINAWEYSLMKDATTALLDIANDLTKKIAKAAGKSTNEIGGKILKACAIGLSSYLTKSKDAVAELLPDKPTIDEIRVDLEMEINNYVKKEEKQGLIFFIDDLDRIDPPVAVQLLELLKNLFTFEHCVFVLAIDYDVVIKGLEPKFGKLTERNEREFRSFFDKIIQVPFSMPISFYQIDDFLKEGLLSIHYLNENQSNNKKLISAFSEISNLSVGTNPRALKRLLNSLLLIQCINNSRDEEQTDSEFKLLVNFALVSIQIAFPLIYRVLSVNPGFDKWNDEILLQMDLPSIIELNTQNTATEEWEKVLFRLCKNDTYLKKQFPNISKILNRLKTLIEKDCKTVEEIIRDIISMSSVTSLDTFDKQPSKKNFSSDGFDIVGEVMVSIENKKYLIKRFSNNMIRLFDETDSPLSIDVLPFLKKINEKYKLGIALLHSTGKAKNTQILGREIVNELKKIQ
jgi:Cdc6-like AAA superfamily ATPase